MISWGPIVACSIDWCHGKPRAPEGSFPGRKVLGHVDLVALNSRTMDLGQSRKAQGPAAEWNTG
jgi:hypothetical protein